MEKWRASREIGEVEGIWEIGKIGGHLGRILFSFKDFILGLT